MKAIRLTHEVTEVVGSIGSEFEAQEDIAGYVKVSRHITFTIPSDYYVEVEGKIGDLVMVRGAHYDVTTAVTYGKRRGQDKTLHGWKFVKFDRRYGACNVMFQADGSRFGQIRSFTLGEIREVVAV